MAAVCGEPSAAGGFPSAGDRFDSLLQTGQHVDYVILIEQTTRSGATYTSGMTINLIVDKVTASPDVQYYSPSDLNNLLQNDSNSQLQNQL